MKKFIAIVAIVLIAVLGLTSYNTNEVKKNESNSTLLASLNNGDTGGLTNNTGAGNKKQD
ncbi:hypothetical protein J2X31_002992 [Flavobacterium arsenatis]|uniref:Uncharacterized protein n=1 Tax=Flavobacterium arsenatis TaxID=1484332 RepID=A0ABU1TSY3_9FLAO|nr:hypothetical protein [Flavobacterium arsenatis]MDR6968966.1 hypothetical protein [Flavobacterium arsenatis]